MLQQPNDWQEEDRFSLSHAIESSQRWLCLRTQHHAGFLEMGRDKFKLTSGSTTIGLTCMAPAALPNEALTHDFTVNPMLDVALIIHTSHICLFCAHALHEIKVYTVHKSYLDMSTPLLLYVIVVLTFSPSGYKYLIMLLIVLSKNIPDKL